MKTGSFFRRLLHSQISGLVVVIMIALALSAPAFCDEIHLAAQQGDLAKVKKLVKHRHDLVSSKDDSANTPLHLAAFYNHKDVAQVLLAEGADVNAKDNGGWTPLHEAAMEGHAGVAEFLLANKADVNAKDNNAETPLHKAAYVGHKNVAELLLANKADVNAKAGVEFNGRTPLHWAARQGHRDLAELLLGHGADVNSKANDGASPLYEAASNGHKDVAELLLAKGADVNAMTNDGATALMVGSDEGHDDIRELLLGKGALERTGAPICTSAQIEEMVAEISRRITPFHLADAGDGFKNELNSKGNAASSIIGTPQTTVLGTARSRPNGGKTSVEIYMKEGKLHMISFKILEGPDQGLRAMWDAKPSVILTYPTTASTSNGNGFKRVTLIKDRVATEYRLVGPNSWSVGTHLYE